MMLCWSMFLAATKELKTLTAFPRWNQISTTRLSTKSYKSWHSSRLLAHLIGKDSGALCASMGTNNIDHKRSYVWEKICPFNSVCPMTCWPLLCGSFDLKQFRLRLSSQKIPLWPESDVPELCSHPASDSSTSVLQAAEKVEHFSA